MTIFSPNNYHHSIILWCSLCIIFTSNSIYSQDVYHSLVIVSTSGTRYYPANIPVQFIASIFVDSLKSCAVACNINPFCRVFDYGAAQLNECLLFEGNIDILGTIISSAMPDSRVGAIQLNPSLFTQYGQSCSSVCIESRYLICNKNSVCDCVPHTYWDASVGMCLVQMSMPGAPCQKGIHMCREDLSLTCSVNNQCETSVPQPVGGGTTIADRNTIIEGSGSNGLEYPMGITVDENGNGECLIVVDSIKNEVIRLWNIGSSKTNISVLARNWTSGNSLSSPTYLFLDPTNQNDLYVADGMNGRVVLLSSMQLIAPPPKDVAGTFGASGVSPQFLAAPNGITVDSQKNVIVADTYNYRIMLWAPDATAGVMIAGTGTAGNSSTELQFPIGLFLDQINSLLYVADRDNHRIQLFNLNSTPPYNGTTVAGGNGVGSGSRQLNQPSDVWVSSITGAVYIADTGNHRIQRWDARAVEGITIAGDSHGIQGTDSTKLSYPSGLSINKNETRLYVSDTVNQRIQCFDLSSK